MSKRSGWWIAFVGLAVVALVVAAAVASALLPPRQTGDIAAPPGDATPEQVVTSYLEALNAHDCDTAAALMVEGAESSARLWCEDVASLKDVEVREHVMELPEYSGHEAPDEVAYVPVSFDLDWRPFHDDGSMDEGATGWGYLVVRSSADTPWRIFDQGVG